MNSGYFGFLPSNKISPNSSVQEAGFFLDWREDVDLTERGYGIRATESPERGYGQATTYRTPTASVHRDSRLLTLGVEPDRSWHRYRVGKDSLTPCEDEKIHGAGNKMPQTVQSGQK